MWKSFPTDPFGFISQGKVLFYSLYLLDPQLAPLTPFIFIVYFSVFMFMKKDLFSSQIGIPANEMFRENKYSKNGAKFLMALIVIYILC